VAKHSREPDDDPEPCPCTAGKSSHVKKREGASRIALVTAVVTLLGAVLTVFGIWVKNHDSPPMVIAPADRPSLNLAPSPAPVPEAPAEDEIQPNPRHSATPPATTTTEAADGHTTEPPSVTTTSDPRPTTSETPSAPESSTPSESAATPPSTPSTLAFDDLEPIGSVVVAHLTSAVDTPSEPQKPADTPTTAAETSTTPAGPSH
jgi:hypothetical protein